MELEHFSVGTGYIWIGVNKMATVLSSAILFKPINSHMVYQRMGGYIWTRGRLCLASTQDLIIWPSIVLYFHQLRSQSRLRFRVAILNDAAKTASETSMLVPPSIAIIAQPPRQYIVTLHLCCSHQTLCLFSVQSCKKKKY